MSEPNNHWWEREVDIGAVEVSLATTGVSVLLVNAEAHVALRVAGAIAFVLSTFAAYLIGWVYVFGKVPLTRSAARHLENSALFGFWVLYGWPVRLVRLVSVPLLKHPDEELVEYGMELWLENAYLVLWSALTVVWVAGFGYVIASLL
jgi:putative flippase GtrA